MPVGGKELEAKALHREDKWLCFHGTTAIQRINYTGVNNEVADARRDT